jgi:hypothetical protein
MALNNKQKVFIAEYLKDFNATQAAIRAGYSERTAYSQGHRLLKHVEVAERISEVIEDRTMKPEEVLLRLGDQARGDMGDFLEIGEDAWSVDLYKAKVAGKTHLIKKIKQRTSYREDGETEVWTEFEMYDAHAALVDVGRALGIFKDSPIDVNINLSAQLLEFLDKVYGSKDHAIEEGTQQEGS